MKKTQIAKIRGVLQRANPFMIYMTGTTVPMVYTDDVKAYYDIMLRLFFTYPNGYMDLPLFLIENMGLNLSDAEELCGKRDVFNFPIYDYDYPNRKDKLREILVVLLKHTGCDFNQSAFETALTQFDMFVLENNIKERVIDGSILEFSKTYGNEENNNSTSRY